MFIPARHDLILAKAAEVFNLMPVYRPLDVITAFDIYKQTQPNVNRNRLSGSATFTKIWDGFQHGGDFQTHRLIDTCSTELTRTEWWFICMLAWKYTSSITSSDALKTSGLKYYLNYLRNLLVNKKPFIHGTNEAEILIKVRKLYFNTEHVTLASPAFRMALNTAMALTVEGWANRFNTFSSPVGTRSVFPWESYPEIYRDIVDLHVDQRIALPDAIGIVVTQHREMLARAVQELIAAKPD